MPPAKRTAATKRTTPVPPDDFVVKKPKSTTFNAFGKTWKIAPGNVVFLANMEETTDLTALLKFVLSHIDKAQREDFVSALTEADGMDIENLVALQGVIQEKAYSHIPTNPS